MNSQMFFTAFLILALASSAANAQNTNVVVASTGSSSSTSTTVVVVYANGGATVVVVSTGKRDLPNGNSSPGPEPDVILRIQYSDGQPDDEALLWYQSPTKVDGKHDAADDECLLSGHLLDDPNVQVSVVGCPSNDEFEMVFASKKLNDTMFKVVNGTALAMRVKEEKQAFDVDVQSNDDVDDKTHGHPKLNAPCHSKEKPKKIIFNISLNYDREFHDFFGSSSSSQLGKVITLVKPVFLLPSLNTKIILNFVGGFGFYNQNLNAGKDISKAKAFAETHPTNAHAYIIISKFNGNATGMAATIGSVCSKDRGSRTAIVEWYENELYTSRTLAREVGHLLGMKPDFIMKKKSSSLIRHDRVHRDCTNQGGFMDYYGEVRNKWTTCSNDDFCEYKKYVVDTTGSFCAFDCDRDDGPGCDVWKELGICSTQKYAQHCAKTCNFCESFF